MSKYLSSSMATQVRFAAAFKASDILNETITSFLGLFFSNYKALGSRLFIKVTSHTVFSNKLQLCSLQIICVLTAVGATTSAICNHKWAITRAFSFAGPACAVLEFINAWT